MLRLQTFGTFGVERAGVLLGGAAAQPKALAVLALLAPAGARGMSRDRLAAYLWPEGAGSRVTHRLTQVLYSLRRDLQADDLFLGSGVLRLNPAVVNSDLGEFLGALEAGEFAGAVRCYAGPFLEGFYLKEAPEFEHWVEAERERLAARYRAALEALAHGAAQRGDLAAAAGWRKKLVEADPVDPAAVEHYAELLEALGDGTGALRFLQSHAAMLRAEFDVDPDPRLRVLADRLAAVPATPGAMPIAPSVAVLAFVNLTPDRENQYFSAGMAEELTNSLSRVPGLRVVSRLAAQRVQHSTADPATIASQLGVSLLVGGSVRKVGNRIRIAAQLVDGRDGRQWWSQTWERTLEDVFALQEELCRAIVAALPISAEPGPAPLAPNDTSVIDAYTLYLRGRYAAHRRTPEGLALAAEYFEQAVERDPHYALAYAGLAECLALQGFPEFGTAAPQAMMPRAKLAAREALRLDPRLADAHTWMGVVHFLFDWGWAEAEAEFRRALQLKRDNAYAQTWYGCFLAAMGRHDESLRRILYAETLEPAAPQIRMCVPRAYYWAGRFEAALESVLDIWRADTGAPLAAIWAARILSALGRDAEGLAMLERVPGGQRSPYVQSAIAVALAALGRQEEARRLCDALQSLDDAAGAAGVGGLARARWLLGDPEAGIEALRTAIRKRNGMFAWLAVDFYYDCFRTHPAFETLLGELGLPSRPAIAR